MRRLINKLVVIAVVLMFCATLVGSFSERGAKYFDGFLGTLANPSVDDNEDNNGTRFNEQAQSNASSNFCPTCEECPAGFYDGRNTNANKDNRADL